MIQRIGREEIIGEYHGFKQARKRTVQEQNPSTFKLALHYLIGPVRKLLCKIWSWHGHSGLIQPKPLYCYGWSGRNRIPFKDLRRMSLRTFISLGSPMFITMEPNLSISVLVSIDWWKMQQKELNSLREHVGKINGGGA
jgi:hypothetical protein